MTTTRYGLCCMHTALEERGHRFQTMTHKRFKDIGRDAALPVLCERYLANLITVRETLIECAKHNWCYRASSDIFPLMTLDEANVSYDELPNKRVLDHLFCQCADIIAQNKIRVSCHPDQFNVLASENPVAVDRTVRELDHHGWFMTKLGAPLSYDAPINIHINATRGDIVDIVKRFISNFVRLSDDVKKRLVVETEDKGIWHASNLYYIFFAATKIPITFDYLHHKCNNDGMSEEDAFKLCATTWHGHTPLFHYCESMPNQKNPRKHADFPTAVPNTYNINVDLDYEFKMKDAAILHATKLVAPCIA